MAEFKFSCPHCAQNIQCDAGYSGVQINCPSCQQAIIVPQAPRAAAEPPSILTTQRPTATAAGQRFAGASGGQPQVQKKSNVARNVVIIAASIVVLAALGFGGWFGYSKFKGHEAAAEAKKGNPAAQVAAPTSAATVQALSILTKVHSAYTNITSVKADGTVSLFLDLSNITVADVNPTGPPNANNAKRHPPGMPRMVTNTTDISVRRAQTNSYYISGEAVSKVDRMTMTNTFAFWKSDKGQFMFMDSHQKMAPATYMQLADANPANGAQEQIQKMQHLFDDPANLTKIIKDLGQTDDESVNGQDCYTLTAKVLGQKVKIWVDKATYLIPQWQITLGGAISDADIDDAFSLYESAFTNLPPAALEGIKAQVKIYTPVMTKIRGTIASTSRNLELNPALSADDFSYPVPPGVRLVRMPAAATTTQAASLEVQQRNADINNLRQIDAAKNEFALEKGKANGAAVTEADITPYLVGGKMPTCPAGGTYTIGKVGENPTSSIPGDQLP